MGINHKVIQAHMEPCKMTQIPGSSMTCLRSSPSLVFAEEVVVQGVCVLSDDSGLSNCIY